MNAIFNIIIIGLILYFAFKFHVLVGFLALVVLGIIGYISNYPRIMAGRANAEFAQNNYDKALKLYEKAYKSNNRKYTVDISYAQALLKTGKPEAALEILNKILGLRITKDLRRPATMIRCMIKYKLNDLEEAYEDATELFEDGYTTSNMYGILGLLMHEKNEPIEKITEFCLTAYDYDADNRDIVDNLILCYIKQNKPDEAIELAKALTENYPYFVEAWYHLAEAYLLAGDKLNAKSSLDKTHDCERSYLTTITEEEIQDMYKELN